jgi:hypothetical protein
LCFDDTEPYSTDAVVERFNKNYVMEKYEGIRLKKWMEVEGLTARLFTAGEAVEIITG